MENINLSFTISKEMLGKLQQKVGAEGMKSQEVIRFALYDYMRR